MNKLKKNNGSALVWVLVICLIFGLLGVAIGGIALSMNNRSINNNSRQQAYFTARSGADIILDYLNADINKYPFTKYLYQNLINGSHSIQIDNIFADPRIETGDTFVEGLGECKIEGSYIDGVVTIIASAKVSGEEEKITLTAKRNQDGAIWPARVWGVPLVEKSPGIIAVGALSDRKAGKDEEDLVSFAEYIVGSGDEYAHSGKLKVVSASESNENQAIFIYVNEKQALTLNGIEGWDEHYGPDIYIYLEGNAKLYLKAGTYPFYISAASGAHIELSGIGTAEVFHINGDLTGVVNVKFEETSTKIPKRVPRSNFYYSGTIDPTNGARGNKWDVIQYKESE